MGSLLYIAPEQTPPAPLWGPLTGLRTFSGRNGCRLSMPTLSTGHKFRSCATCSREPSVLTIGWLPTGAKGTETKPVSRDSFRLFDGRASAHLVTRVDDGLENDGAHVGFLFVQDPKHLQENPDIV